MSTTNLYFGMHISFSKFLFRLRFLVSHRNLRGAGDNSGSGGSVTCDGTTESFEMPVESTTIDNPSDIKTTTTAKFEGNM